MISYGRERFDLVLQPISGRQSQYTPEKYYASFKLRVSSVSTSTHSTCTIIKKGWTWVLAVAQPVFARRKETSYVPIHPDTVP